MLNTFKTLSRNATALLFRQRLCGSMVNCLSLCPSRNIPKLYKSRAFGVHEKGFYSSFGWAQNRLDFLQSQKQQNFSQSVHDLGSKDWRGRNDLQPAPRSLSEVVKLPLLKLENSTTVRKIWLQHHTGSAEEDIASTSMPVVATTMDEGEYNLLRSRAAICPFFVIPVRRDEGHFVMLVQWQNNVCLFTFLDEYKKNPHAAEPWAALTMYNELIPTHNMALARSDYNPFHLKKPEAQRLMDIVRVYYTQGNQYEMVEAFNHRPDTFDFERHLRECK